MDRETTVQGYLAYLSHYRISPERRSEPQQRDNSTLSVDRDNESYFDEWETVDALITDDPDEAWQVLLETIARCHEDDLYLIGCGELENFFVLNVVSYSGRIEEQLRANPRFFSAFRWVRMGGVPEEAWRHFNSVLAELGVPPEEIIEWWTWVDENDGPGG